MAVIQASGANGVRMHGDAIGLRLRGLSDVTGLQLTGTAAATVIPAPPPTPRLVQASGATSAQLAGTAAARRLVRASDTTGAQVMLAASISWLRPPLTNGPLMLQVADGPAAVLEVSDGPGGDADVV